MQAQASTTMTTPRSVKPATVLFTLAVIAFVGVVTIALTHIGGAGSTPTVLGPAEAGSVAELETGGELSITLPANPSTGYGWVVTSINPTLLTQIGEPEFSAESDLVGAGGTITLRFEGVSAGQSDLQLDYLRPWEDLEPLDSYQVTINVR